MTITFFSSVLNHHQHALCRKLFEHPNVQFTFVQMNVLTDERKAQGFCEYKETYVVYASEEPNRAYRLCMESDVVIAGVAPQDWVNERISQGKLTFAYKERFLKKKKTFFNPAFWKHGYFNYYRYRNQRLYLLCASYYTGRDTKFIFPRKEKKFKWGYFPEITKSMDCSTVLEKKYAASILWVGRFISLKHPEIAIAAANQLKDLGYKFTMNFIGTGELESQIKQMIHDKHLERYVHIIGAMKPDHVRQKMRETDIFLFTSDIQEGWGAVLNEAMSEGCACIASKQAGSTLFLIKDGQNGFTYDYDDIATLVNKITILLDDRQKLTEIQKKAMDTIKQEWNAEVAAHRLVEFCKAEITKNALPFFLSGPMSLT